MCALPCQHPYISHRPAPAPATDLNYRFQRGPCQISGCAGFSSVRTYLPFSCCDLICSIHRRVLLTGTRAAFAYVATAGMPTIPCQAYHSRMCFCCPSKLTHSPASSSAAAPVQANVPLNLGFSNPPVDSFFGILPPPPPPNASMPAPSPPAPGTTNGRRTSSASRTLPPHQGAVANASAAHRGPRSQYPPPTQHPRPGALASSSSALTVNPFSPPRVAVLIWPYVVSINPLGYSAFSKPLHSSSVDVPSRPRARH